MENKYNLSRKESLFLANKTFVEKIYFQAKAEGCNITFPQTKSILEGVNVGGVNLDDILIIQNLKRAWNYCVKELDTDLNLDFILGVNRFVSENESLDWGVLRYGNVGISGTDYKPSLPVKEDVERFIDHINSIDNVTDRAIRYFIRACKMQLFWDGNKRSSNIIANKILLSEGAGILAIEEKNINEFNALLSEFYTTDNSEKIEKFLYEECIYGIDY